MGGRSFFLFLFFVLVFDFPFLQNYVDSKTIFKKNLTFFKENEQFSKSNYFKIRNFLKISTFIKSECFSNPNVSNLNFFKI
jgi:hypothetical protein